MTGRGNLRGMGCQSSPRGFDAAETEISPDPGLTVQSSDVPASAPRSAATGPGIVVRTEEEALTARTTRNRNVVVTVTPGSGMAGAGFAPLGFLYDACQDLFEPGPLPANSPNRYFVAFEEPFQGVPRVEVQDCCDGAGDGGADAVGSGYGSYDGGFEGGHRTEADTLRETEEFALGIGQTSHTCCPYRSNPRSNLGRTPAHERPRHHIDHLRTPQGRGGAPPDGGVDPNPRLPRSRHRRAGSRFAPHPQTRKRPAI